MAWRLLTGCQELPDGMCFKIVYCTEITCLKISIALQGVEALGVFPTLQLKDDEHAPPRQYLRYELSQACVVAKFESDCHRPGQPLISYTVRIGFATARSVIELCQ